VLDAGDGDIENLVAATPIWAWAFPVLGSKRTKRKLP
jgi:hypothetical protein